MRTMQSIAQRPMFPSALTLAVVAVGLLDPAAASAASRRRPHRFHPATRQAASPVRVPRRLADDISEKHNRPARCEHLHAVLLEVRRVNARAAVPAGRAAC